MEWIKEIPIVIQYFLILLSQIGNAYFRGWNIESISKHNFIQARLSWFLYGIMFLISLALGIKSLAFLDFIGISVWFIGGMLGQEYAMLHNKKRYDNSNTR